MGWLNTLLGGGQAAAAPIEAVGNALDKLFTSDDERLDKQTLLERLAQRPQEWQMAINLAQAQHRSVFVAGARPFILWVCGFGVAWHFILYDLLTWVTLVWFPNVPPLPPLNTDGLLALMVPLLGLASLRTIEKSRGLTR